MTTKALAVVQQQTALARPIIQFDAAQRRIILDSCAPGATEKEFAPLMMVAEQRGLNPLTKQIHFVKRWDSNRRCEVWAFQVAIDGFRAIAERTGKYDGQDDAVFEYDKSGGLLLARVNVYKKGISRPFTGTARFREYAQTKKDGSLTSMWQSKPHVMLAKCAEALGLRKAFPDDLGGFHTPEEMGQRQERVVGAGAVDGEIVDEAAPIVAQLVQQLEQGFPTTEAKKAWVAEHQAVKASLSTAELARISDALRRAPIGQQQPQKPEPPAAQQEPPDEEPPDDLPNEPPIEFGDEQAG